MLDLFYPGTPHHPSAPQAQGLFSDTCLGVAHFKSSVKGRVSGEAQFFAAKYYFLIYDSYIRALYFILNVGEKVIVIIRAVIALAAFCSFFMKKDVAYHNY